MPCLFTGSSCHSLLETRGLVAERTAVDGLCDLRLDFILLLLLLNGCCDLALYGLGLLNGLGGIANDGDVDLHRLDRGWRGVDSARGRDVRGLLGLDGRHVCEKAGSGGAS
jgi:hypothetical protein